MAGQIDLADNAYWESFADVRAMAAKWTGGVSSSLSPHADGGGPDLMPGRGFFSKPYER